MRMVISLEKYILLSYLIFLNSPTIITGVKQIQKEKPRRGVSLDKAFGSNIFDIIPVHIRIVSLMASIVNCF